MERGIHVAGGDRIGKTIIFAQNKSMRSLFWNAFNKLYPNIYPEKKGIFAQRVICDDAYAQTVIDDFKVENKPPFIAVSVDMMDTGIDVPQCVNLVFFKKVRSKAKFWQMIGRGTRLCKGLTCMDPIDGEYTDKRRFLIFDYCGNFEYFREHIEGFVSKETKSLSENIFGKQIRLISLPQEACYAEGTYEEWRKELISGCHNQLVELDPKLISVKLKLQYVEKFKQETDFDVISEGDKGELLQHIAPLVHLNDEDELAKRFDNFMYGLMLASMEQMPSFKRAKKVLCEIAGLLSRKISIPQVKEKLDFIQEIQTDEFWKVNDVLQFERVRQKLRELMRFFGSRSGGQDDHDSFDRFHYRSAGGCPVRCGI